MYPTTFREAFPCGRGFEWTLKGHYLEKKFMCSKNISLESIEWLDFMQSDPRFVNSKNRVCKIKHGWNSEEVKIGSYNVDGFVKVDNISYVLEYDGCSYHDCSKCKNNIIFPHKNEKEKAKFFEEYTNIVVIRISSCEWQEKRQKIKYESKISPILMERKIHKETFLELIRQNKLYGFALVDIVSTSKSKMFLELNFLPILQKQMVNYDDLPSWMRQNSDKKSFPRETIVQKMNAKNILLHTELIKFYQEHGFFITSCHKFFEYQPEKCFKQVHDKVYKARVEASIESDTQKATAIKLVSNSMYGRFLMNPKRFEKTRLMTHKGFERYRKSITYKRSHSLSENLMEITRAKSSYVEKYPIHCGLTVLHLSKLILLRFIVFLYDHLEAQSFEILYTGNILRYSF